MSFFLFCLSLFYPSCFAPASSSASDWLIWIFKKWPIPLFSSSETQDVNSSLPPSFPSFLHSFSKKQPDGETAVERQTATAGGKPFGEWHHSLTLKLSLEGYKGLIVSSITWKNVGGTLWIWQSASMVQGQCDTTLTQKRYPAVCSCITDLFLGSWLVWLVFTVCALWRMLVKESVV